MKKSMTQLLGMLFALALLAAVGWAAWLGLEQLAALFAALDAQVARVTAIASVVVLAAAAIVATALRRVGRERFELPLREEKSATYRLFVDCWQQRLDGQANPALDDALNSLDRMLALFGSEEMASVHLALRDLVRRPDPAKDDWMPLLGGALLQIRKELKTDKVAASVLESLVGWPTRERVASPDPELAGVLPVV